MKFFLLQQAQEMVSEFSSQFKKKHGLDIIDQATILRFLELHNAKDNTIKFIFDGEVIFQVDFSDNTLNATIFKT